MFGKKKETGVKPQEAKTEGQQPVKAKKLSPKDEIIQNIEQLHPGESLIYQLHEMWGAEVKDDVAIIEVNPQHPLKGMKYRVNFDKLVDGKLAGTRTFFSESNKPKDLASWVLSNKGDLFRES